MIQNSWFYLLLTFILGWLIALPGIRRNRVTFIFLVNIGVYSILAINLLPALFLYCGLTYFFALIIRDGKFRSGPIFSLSIFILVTLGLFILGKVWPDALIKKNITLSYLIPLGFSYVCLQNLAFVIDTKNKKHRDFPSLIEFLASSMFFPNIASGPIADLYEVKRQLVADTTTEIDAKVGVQRIMNGFFKKTISDLISTTLLFPDAARFVSEPKLFFLPGLLLKFYLDFSGYIDMAIGIALILGVRLPENFNRPYACVTMADYWNRWHMTLGNWFKNYFFYPLQILVFRKTRLRESIQIALVGAILFLTFVMIGLWHGISLKFFYWGLFNASLVLLSNKLIRLRFLFGVRLGAIVFGGLTLFLVFAGQLLLLSESSSLFLQNFATLFSFANLTPLTMWITLGMALWLFGQHQLDGSIADKKFASKWRYGFLISAQLIISVILHKNGGAFLYAGF